MNLNVGQASRLPQPTRSAAAPALLCQHGERVAEWSVRFLQISFRRFILTHSLIRMDYVFALTSDLVTKSQRPSRSRGCRQKLNSAAAAVCDVCDRPKRPSQSAASICSLK